MARLKKTSRGDRPVTQAELRSLIAAARETLRQNHDPRRHGVGAAVLARSGKTYVGVNVEACGYGPCAEPIALGAAITAGERHFRAFVAVCREGKRFPVLSPCGNCRQLILDYAPRAVVVFSENGKVRTAPVTDLLPGAYRSGFGKRR
jgi:cytidine deaminase